MFMKNSMEFHGKFHGKFHGVHETEVDGIHETEFHEPEIDGIPWKVP
jgi:hypothetical protein